jgi:hypothetical protein
MGEVHETVSSLRSRSFRLRHMDFAATSRPGKPISLDFTPLPRHSDTSTLELHGGPGGCKTGNANYIMNTNFGLSFSYCFTISIWKEVYDMKRFTIPRMAHCEEGCE